MTARAWPMQADLFNTTLSSTPDALPAASRAAAVQLLASLLHEVDQAQARQHATAEAGHEQDQR